jgi:hypothetical protein
MRPIAGAPAIAAMRLASREAAGRERQQMAGTIDDALQLTSIISPDDRFQAASSLEQLSRHDPLLTFAATA